MITLVLGSVVGFIAGGAVLQLLRWSKVAVYIAEVVLTVIVTVLLASVLWPHILQSPWIPRSYLHLSVAQFALGVLAGVLMRFVFIDLHRQLTERQAKAQHPQGNQPDASHKPSKESGKEPASPTVTILFVILAVTALALLAPHLDSMLAQLDQLKIFGVELKISGPERNRAAVELNRRVVRMRHLQILTDSQGILRALKSEQRLLEVQYRPNQPRIDATRRFEDLYKNYWWPLAKCVTTALKFGATSDEVVSRSRPIADPYWQALLALEKNDAATAQKAFATSQSAVKDLLRHYAWINKYSPPVKDGIRDTLPCDEREVKVFNIDRAHQSAWPYLMLAILRYFHEDRFEAIRLLESIERRFDNDLNIYNFLGTFWMLEMPTLPKARDNFSRLKEVAQFIESTAAEVAKDPAKKALSAEIDPPKRVGNLARSALSYATGQQLHADAVFKMGQRASYADHLAALDEARHAIRTFKALGWDSERPQLALQTYVLGLLVVGVEENDTDKIACARMAVERLARRVYDRSVLPAANAARSSRDFSVEFPLERDAFEELEQLVSTATKLHEASGKPRGCQMKSVMELITNPDL